MPKLAQILDTTFWKKLGYFWYQNQIIIVVMQEYFELVLKINIQNFQLLLKKLNKRYAANGTHPILSKGQINGSYESKLSTLLSSQNIWVCDEKMLSGQPLYVMDETLKSDGSCNTGSNRTGNISDHLLSSFHCSHFLWISDFFIFHFYYVERTFIYPELT